MCVCIYMGVWVSVVVCLLRLACYYCYYFCVVNEKETFTLCRYWFKAVSGNKEWIVVCDLMQFYKTLIHKAESRKCLFIFYFCVFVFFCVLKFRKQFSNFPHAELCYRIRLLVIVTSLQILYNVFESSITEEIFVFKMHIWCDKNGICQSFHFA